QALREHVYPELGSAKLQDVRAGDVQRLVDRLVARGLNPSTVRNALLPLRSICRRAVRQGDISANPTAGVELPAVRGRRTRIVTPVEALTLINNAPPEDRPLWATAFYAGLRRGELQALIWDGVDLAGGLISVERSWDRRATRRACLESTWARARDPPRMPPHVRHPDDRGRCQRQGAPDVHGPLVDHGHPRPLRHLFPGSEEQAARLLDTYLKDAHERARHAEINPCGKRAGKTTPEKGGSERRKAVSSAANRKPPRTANAPKLPANHRD